MDIETLKRKIILSSIPLRKLGADMKPVGSASGCLVRYAGKLLVLTVAHATGDLGNWAIEMQIHPELGRTACYQIGGMNFLQIGDMNTNKLREVDFSYAVLKDEITPLHQQMALDRTIQSSVETVKLTSDFKHRPKAGLEYGFFGHTKLKHDGNFLKLEPRLEMGMQFVGEDDDEYVFQMHKRDMRIEEYKGCSGSPILDSNGELVSITVAVNIEECKVYGVKLWKYKAPIDIECGNFM